MRSLLVASLLFLAGCQCLRCAPHSALAGCCKKKGVEEAKQQDKEKKENEKKCPSRVAFNGGERAELEAYAPATMRRIDFGQSLTLDDIRQLSALGFSDAQIFYQLQRTETNLSLTGQQHKQLEEWGVRASVIDHIFGKPAPANPDDTRHEKAPPKCNWEAAECS